MSGPKAHGRLCLPATSILFTCRNKQRNKGTELTQEIAKRIDSWWVSCPVRPFWIQTLLGGGMLTDAGC